MPIKTIYKDEKAIFAIFRIHWSLLPLYGDICGFQNSAPEHGEKPDNWKGKKDDSVISALLDVRRHLFVDMGMQSQAYSDNALPISQGQTISQP